MTIDEYTKLCYVDSHCHFDFPDFDDDRQQVWDSCKQRGLTHLLVPGVEPKQWPKAFSLSERYPEIFYALGLHPWFIESFVADFTSIDKALEQLEAGLVRSSHNKSCVALGECGLDKHIEVPLELQQGVLQLQIDVAKQLDKPLILHCRKYHSELQKMLKKAGKLRGVIHGFSGSIELAHEYWSMGFYIGVGGTITYPRANKTREACRQLPLAALLLESDAPDMPMLGRQGERNSPEYIPDIAAVLAELRGESLAEISQHTSQNAALLFGFGEHA